MYVLGPDNERVEVLTGVEKRFNHVHFTSPDVPALTRWYADFLGLTMNVTSGLTYAAFALDDIGFFFETIGERNDYKPSDDYVWSHIAFSVTDLSAWLSRARAQNIEVVAEPALVHGFTSFFVRGPDGVLIELVQAVASKELCHQMN